MKEFCKSQNPKIYLIFHYINMLLWGLGIIIHIY